MIIKAAILQDGVVYTGHRHSDVIRDMIMLYDTVYKYASIQGFVTDTDQFLNRVDALDHFIKAGQKSVSGPFRANQLSSEDLY